MLADRKSFSLWLTGGGKDRFLLSKWTFF